ncbi:hypothetical protein AB0I28_09785 [Phytomonospora sp. NPDC050363]|uniref:hypothetical protein n=1 Tax=Phytomonospora sp. NPDC050363 TaxID=3155642 RepID=UPI0033C0B14C
MIEDFGRDPDLRRVVAGDPRLPLPRVLELLDDPATSQAAARNPNLPVPVMERILDEAGVA